MSGRAYLRVSLPSTEEEYALYQKWLKEQNEVENDSAPEEEGVIIIDMA